eukprot:CAMPEP_0181064958 /NCGR_PEP_ID=MMETSP1070-20121207/24479_1 /TAXON_ID=265543 /ORGANISM="Minutocellus polymorphus, Strain NH13" /LENGTH=257 /DNA_ID=CAMNT_0023145309 /DNA_START=15 /DNA_END=788 /DNA_ORIENTATION=+
MSPLISLLALLATASAASVASVRAPSTSPPTETRPSSPPPPIPFAPPSQEFCNTNTLGDDVYLSFFVPCEFIFYTVDGDEGERPSDDHFACDSIDDSDSATIIKQEDRKVMLWPESCVALGPRCYDLSKYPNLYNFTLFEGTEFAMKFPSGANVVSVDCSADYAKVTKFVENLPIELKEVAEAIGFAAFVVSFAVLMAVVACICWCCGTRGRPSSDGKCRHGSYVTVPPELNEPVTVMARPYQPQKYSSVYGKQEPV